MKKLLIIAISFVALACKVTYSFRGGQIPGQTFSIESFTNTATLVNPNLAIVIQDELQEKFSNESNLKYTDGIGDAHFTGSIINYSITPVQGTGAETVALNRLTIKIKVSYANSENNNQDFDQTFEMYDDFESTDDFSTVEDKLMKSISEKLIDQIYQKTMTEW